MRACRGVVIKSAVASMGSSELAAEQCSAAIPSSKERLGAPARLDAGWMQSKALELGAEYQACVEVSIKLVVCLRRAHRHGLRGSARRGVCPRRLARI